MALDPDKLQLTDFLDLSTLQEIQDSFTAVAGVKAIIADADGNVLTQVAPAPAFLRRQQTLAEHGDLIQREGEFVAPIVVNDRQLGMLRMSVNGSDNGNSHEPDEAKINDLSRRFGVDAARMKEIAAELADSRNALPAAIQFMF